MRSKKHVLSVVLATCFAIPMVLAPVTATQVNQAAQNERLALNISINERTLHLPVTAPADGYIMFALVPVRSGLALKVVPIMQGGKVQLDAQLISTGLSSARTCREKFRLQGELIGSFLAGRGDTLTIERNGLAITFAAVERAPDLERNAGAGTSSRNSAGNSFAPASWGLQRCECGRCPRGGNDPVLMCCPNLNTCIECGSCGNVCCIPALDVE